MFSATPDVAYMKGAARRIKMHVVHTQGQTREYLSNIFQQSVYTLQSLELE